MPQTSRILELSKGVFSHFIMSTFKITEVDYKKVGVPLRHMKWLSGMIIKYKNYHKSPHVGVMFFQILVLTSRGVTYVQSALFLR